MAKGGRSWSVTILRPSVFASRDTPFLVDYTDSEIRLSVCIHSTNLIRCKYTDTGQNISLIKADVSADNGETDKVSPITDSTHLIFCI
jgi:hypothetical protein